MSNPRTNSVLPTAAPASAALSAAGALRDPAAALASQLVEADMADADMARRLRAALNGDTWACAGLKLGLRQETVRRVCQSGRPTARFMARLCRAYGVDGHWLLTGQGTAQMAARELTALKGVRAESLIDEVALRLRSALAANDSAGGRVDTPASSLSAKEGARPPAGAHCASGGEGSDILGALATAARRFGEVRVVAGGRAEPSRAGSPHQSAEQDADTRPAAVEQTP